MTKRIDKILEERDQLPLGLALDDAAVVGWEDARGPAISSSRDTKTEPSEETWSPRVPQTYARAENVRDVDDGHVPPIRPDTTDTTHANEPFDEPFGGGDAEARLASVDARLKTFAARWES